MTPAEQWWPDMGFKHPPAKKSQTIKAKLTPAEQDREQPGKPYPVSRPAEQGQETRVQRWTICVSDDHRNAEDLERGACPDCGEPLIEVVPAEDWEMAYRYFPFMRRDRDHYKRSYEALREALEALIDEADMGAAALGACSASGDSDNLEEAVRKARAALDQSGKP